MNQYREEFDFNEPTKNSTPSRYHERSPNHQSTNVTVHVTGARTGFIGWHFFHAIMTLLTLGLWLPIWMLHFIIYLSTK